jgi:hypothetical protein
MQDRASTKPNRYAVYDDAHNFIRYEYHERADEPTQAGDALNKANLLPDAVATALGLPGNPQVSDALAKVKILIDNNTTLANSKARIDTGSYVGTGVYGDSNPNTLTFPERPIMLLIFKDVGISGPPDYRLAAFYPYVLPGDYLNASFYRGLGSFQTSNNEMSKYSNNILSWYTTSANAQMNVSGITYTWAAFYN